MKPEEAYDLLLPSIESIDDAETKIPNMPVDNFIEEALALASWSKDDSKALMNIGVKKEVFDELPIRIEALRQAQSIWKRDNRTRADARKEWDKREPETRDLKNEIEHAFRYAFRMQDDLLRRVKQIEKGYDSPDLIQDLNDLAVLGKSNTQLLKAIKFDISKLDLAVQYCMEMGVILGEMNGDEGESKRVKRIRDKAYTYLKQHMDLLRDAGKYVFWKDSDRLIGYSSRYFREMAA